MLLFEYDFAVGYCSFYGKKVDPEPGRCRRTDGKKWRCSKDAYPDSKYCERHMHRGRNRSRKPVESQTTTQSSSTVTSLTVTGGSGSGAGTFQNLPLQNFNNPQGGPGSGTNQSQFHMEPIPYGIPNKDYRYRYNPNSCDLVWYPILHCCILYGYCSVKWIPIGFFSAVIPVVGSWFYVGPICENCVVDSEMEDSCHMGLGYIAGKTLWFSERFRILGPDVHEVGRRNSLCPVFDSVLFGLVLCFLFSLWNFGAEAWHSFKIVPDHPTDYCLLFLPWGQTAPDFTEFLLKDYLQTVEEKEVRILWY